MLRRAAVLKRICDRWMAQNAYRYTNNFHELKKELKFEFFF